MTVNNAKQAPKVYYAKHIEKGVAKYTDGMLYVGDNALKAMSPSFAGKPVYVFHQDVDLENLQQEADGYVSECFYNECDGWFWCKFIAVSDKAHEAITKGWAVSNSYLPLEFGAGGTRNNVDYDSSLLKGEYTHLAIVPNPRYEDACIMTPEQFKAYREEKRQANKQIVNSKSKGLLRMKLFKKKEVENAVDLETAIIQLDDGSEVSLSDALATVKNAKEEEAKAKEDEKKKSVDMDSVVNVGDEKMSIKDLVNAYKKVNAKKNADDEEAKEKANAEDAEKKKEEEKEEQKKMENAKEGKEHFDTLKNSIEKGDEIKNSSTYETMEEKLKRGKERF